jgi:hypothetical protein
MDVAQNISPVGRIEFYAKGGFKVYKRMLIDIWRNEDDTEGNGEDYTEGNGEDYTEGNGEDYTEGNGEDYTEGNGEDYTEGNGEDYTEGNGEDDDKEQQTQNEDLIMVGATEENAYNENIYYHEDFPIARIVSTHLRNAFHIY